MMDANYPWFILVPDRDNISEVFQLDPSDQQQLIVESSILAGAISRRFNADKINIAALGNLVPQLHIHHIARYRNDAAWPAPVWGLLPAKVYSGEQADRVIDKLIAGFSCDDCFTRLPDS